MVCHHESRKCCSCTCSCSSSCSLRHIGTRCAHEYRVVLAVRYGCGAWPKQACESTAGNHIGKLELPKGLTDDSLAILIVGPSLAAIKRDYIPSQACTCRLHSHMQLHRQLRIAV